MLSNEELQELIFLAEYGVDHLGGDDKCKAKEFVKSVKEKTRRIIMGVHANVGFDFFPKQGHQLNCKVEVCFRYDTSKRIDGVIVRDDMESPYLTLIKLSDGRVVSATECQYSVLR